MNNQECKTRPKIINITVMNFHFILTGSCNNINDPYAKLCVSYVVKDMNIKVFNLMSRTNETRNIERDETCKFRCKLDARFRNNKQRCNKGKCRWECKE